MYRILLPLVIGFSHIYMHSLPLSKISEFNNTILLLTGHKKINEKIGSERPGQAAGGWFADLESSPKYVIKTFADLEGSPKYVIKGSLTLKALPKRPVGAVVFTADLEGCPKYVMRVELSSQQS